MSNYTDNTRFHKWCGLDTETKRKRIYEWVKSNVIGKSEFDFYIEQYIGSLTIYKEDK